MTQEVIERLFPVTAPARLKLSNIRGKVLIETGEDGQVVVNATKLLGSGDAQHTEILISQDESGRVVVETKYREWFLSIFNFSTPCQVEYHVRVPRACEVEASVVSSTLTVHGVDGACHLSTVSGEVDLKDLKGDLHISSVSGDVLAETLSGQVHLSTVSGNVRLAKSDLSQGKLTTVSGDIRLDTARVAGPYSFSSVSGDVFVTTSQEAGYSVGLHTVSGDLHTNLPVTRRNKNGGSHTVDVQGGGVEIVMNSVSGNLRLEGPEKPAAQPQPVQESISRKDILERIERGEMTVEEGLDSLKNAVG